MVVSPNDSVSEYRYRLLNNWLSNLDVGADSIVSNFSAESSCASVIIEMPVQNNINKKNFIALTLFVLVAKGTNLIFHQLNKLQLIEAAKNDFRNSL